MSFPLLIKRHQYKLLGGKSCNRVYAKDKAFHKVTEPLVIFLSIFQVIFIDPHSWKAIRRELTKEFNFVHKSERVVLGLLTKIKSNIFFSFMLYFKCLSSFCWFLIFQLFLIFIEWSPSNSATYWLTSHRQCRSELNIALQD